MDEQLLKDFLETAKQNQYNWDVIMPKFPELEGIDLQLLKDYTETAIKYNYDYDIINPKFPEFFGEQNEVKKKIESDFISQDQDGVLVTEDISSDIPVYDFEKPQTEQDFFEGTFGDILRSFDAVTQTGLGDFVDDMARSVATGYYQGQVAEDASDILLRGADATDEDIYSFIEANKESQKLGPSDEMMAYQKTYEENGKGFMGVVMGLYESGLQVIPEVILSSITSMATNKDSLVAAGTILGAGATVGGTTGAAGGTAVLPIVGTVTGAAGGAIAGAAATLPYAFAAAGSVLEMGATFSELLQEEIEGELTPEKIREALNDDKIYTSLRNRALARGLTIGVIDAFTGRLGGKVAGGILRKAGKGATKGTKIKSVLAASGIESVGGSVGEATARGVIGQEMDVSEIALEGIAEAPGGIKDVISARFSKPKYKVNGKKVDVETIDNLIETMTLDQLQSTKIKIDNDYEGRAEKLSDRILQLNTQRLILEANPDINPETLSEITKLQLELSSLEGNKTEVAKEKASIIKAKIKDLQENQLEAEVDTEVDAFRELEQSEQLKYIEQASKELVEESEAKGDEEFEITEQQNLQRAVELFNKDQQTETDTEVEVTSKEETEVKEERYKDSQIPVSQQNITYEDGNGETNIARVTTQLDGSRKIEFITEEGTVFSREKVSKDNTLTNEEYITRTTEGDIKTTEDVDIKTVINPKLESKMSDRQRKAAGMDVTPEAEVEVDDEVVYEMNKTNKRIWSKDFEIIDNRNGLELGPVEESNKWAVRNKVTGEMVTVDTKKDAQNIIANAPAYAETFGDGTKVEANMLVTPAPKAEVKVEEQAEVKVDDEVLMTPQEIKETIFKSYVARNEAERKGDEAEVKRQVERGEYLSSLIDEKTRKRMTIASDINSKDAVIRKIEEYKKDPFYNSNFLTEEIKLLEEVLEEYNKIEALENKKQSELNNKKKPKNIKVKDETSLNVIQKIEQRIKTIANISGQKRILNRLDIFKKSPLPENYKNILNADLELLNSSIVKVKDIMDMSFKKFSDYANKVNTTTIDNQIKEAKQKIDSYKKFDKIPVKSKVKSDPKTRKQVTKVEKQVDNARKALNKLDKDIKIVVHNNDASYRKATGEDTREQSTRGEYNPATKTIHINATKVQDNTVAHEVFHALLLRNGITNKQAKAITDKMLKAVKKTASPELLQKLKEHSDNYDSALQSEESIAELFGILASEYKSLDKPTQNLVQRWINKLAKILGVKKFTDAEVIDLLNVVSAKVEAGQEITEQDVAILDGSVSGVINGQARKQDSVLTSFTLKRFPTNPNIKLSEDTPLSNFNQKKSNLLESDRMTGAFIADAQNNPVFKFFGGIYFPQITGKWWASRTLSKATSIAENMNANRDKDGYIYATPIIMKPNSHMSNQDMFETVWEFMKFDLRSKSSKVTKKLFSEYLTKALTLKSVNLTESDLNIKKSDNIETMITKLNKVLLGDDTTLSFEKRKAIIKAILGDPKVTEDRKFPTAGSISEVASKFEEEKTKQATKLWDIVMLMRTKGTLSTKVTPKSDEFYHKSYPAEISSDQEIEVFFLDGAYNIETTYPELTQSSGKVFSWKEYSEKHPSTAFALSQYGRTAKLSKASGDIVAPQSRKQIENKDVVYSAVFFDTNEVTSKYNQEYPNLYSHHSTIEFKPKDVSGLPIGQNKPIKIVGRLTTDKVDVLLVENDLSNNEFPHITLSTAEGVKPFESNKALKENQDKIVPLNDTITGQVGVFTTEGKEFTGAKSDAPQSRKQKTIQQAARDFNMSETGFFPPNADSYFLKRAISRAEGDYGVKKARTGSFFLVDSRGKKVNDLFKRPQSRKQKPSKKPTRKRTSSIKKAITEIKNVLKITPDEQRKIFKALNDQKKRAKDIKKDIVASLRELTKDGKITPSKMVSVINKVPDDFNNPITVERFVEYMTKVFNNADYGNKMMIANAKKGKARKNASTKIGIAEGLVEQLQRLFSVKPSLIPDSVLDQYMELINIFGKRESVLSLPSMEQVTNLTEDVLQQLDEEQSMAIELADRYENADKVMGDDGVDYAATIKQMLDNEVITEREYEVMKKYKSEIKPAEPATPKTEEEIEAERQGVIEDINETKEVDPSVFPSRLERDLAKRFKKLLKTDAVNDLSLDDLKNLFKVIDNINNGYLPHYAQIMVGKMNAINDANLGTNAINRSKLLPLSKIYANLKSKFGRTGKTPTLELIRRNPTFYIDQVFGDFKTKDIFNSIFKRSAEASAKYTKAIKEVQAKIEKVEQAVFKSFGRDPNKVIMSKYKQMSYLIQQEFLSNPDSKQVNSVEDFLKATIKRIKTETTSYTETDAIMLQEILDKYTDNEKKPFDIDQLYESFNVAERNSIRALEEINKSMTEKAVYTANIIRGNKIAPLKNYTHLSVIPDVSKSDIIETETSQISDMFNKYLKPSTKAKSLIERTGKVSPLNFDVYASVQRGAKYTLMDFNLTEPIRTARRTINQIEKNLSDKDGNMPVNARRKFNAIRDASVESIENLLSNALTQNTIADQAVDYIQKQGYRAILAGVPRASYELLSNILAGAFIDPKGIIAGIKNRKLLASPEGKEVMNNLNSTQTNRVFSTGLSGKFVDTGILNQAAGVTASKAKGKVQNTILKFWNKTGQRWIKGVEFTADSLISAPDKLVMQPMWFGAFENRFKQLTGKSPDFNKIASNDEAYMNQYTTELNDAKTLADNRSVAMGATDNAFMGILKGTVKPNQGVLLRGFNAFNGFMTRFLIFEYITARTGIMAAVGNGQVSKKQGAALLAGVTTRMMAYTFMGTLVAESIKGLTEDDEEEDYDFSNFQFEDDDEQGMKSIDKMLGQAMLSAFTSLALGRDFGNATKSIINLGIEDLNERYGQFLRDGEYDKYRDAIQYTIIPEGKSGRPPQFADIAPNLFAAYSPMIKAFEFGVNKIFESDRVEPDAIERQQDERFIRLPLETFGVLGFIPFYKDVRKIVLANMYKGLRKAKKDAANKKKRKAEMLQGYSSETDMKRYDFSLWERTFGPDSPGYETRQAEKELRRKERKLRQQKKDKMYDYTPSKKKRRKQSSPFGPSSNRKGSSPFGPN